MEDKGGFVRAWEVERKSRRVFDQDSVWYF